jgi:Xaa-Pro aminopeptidase
MVDAGTVELVRGLGYEIRTSADLVQQFEAVWDSEQFEMHVEAGKRVDQVRAAAFRKIGESLTSGEVITEYAIQQFIRESFTREGMVTDHGPIVAVNANASNPHYEPTSDSSLPIHRGDLVLIDLWAKLDQPRAVYYDVTWTGVCRPDIPDRIQEVFQVVTGARDAAVAKVQDSVKAGQVLRGYEVDDAARAYIGKGGFGEYFFHRTGHSIGEQVHGTGANMDNLETHDERLLIPQTCFSIEPGIYLPEFGIRSEVNVFVETANAIVTGEIQRELIRISA